MDIGSEELLTDIFQAYFDARKHKKNTKSQLSFEMDPEHNLVALHEQIRERTYRFRPCMCFITEYPDKGEIFASAFRNHLRGLIPRLNDFLFPELKLTLHPDKIVLQHYSKGVLFLRACIRPHRYYPATRTVNMFHAAIRKLERECQREEPQPERLAEMPAVINSYCGHLAFPGLPDSERAVPEITPEALFRLHGKLP